jgi:hypothetical protein
MRIENIEPHHVFFGVIGLGLLAIMVVAIWVMMVSGPEIHRRCADRGLTAVEGAHYTFCMDPKTRQLYAP